MQTNRAAILCYLGEALNRDSKEYYRILINSLHQNPGWKKEGPFIIYGFDEANSEEVLFLSRESPMISR